jgi:hypothetical protein
MGKKQIDPLPEWNKHVRTFAGRHKVRLRLAEDGELRLLLGPRSTENHASYIGGKVWRVYFTAPSSNRVCDSVRDVARRCVPLDGEGFFDVGEKDLLRACSLNRWLRPRFKKEVAAKSAAADAFGAAVQSLDE